MIPNPRKSATLHRLHGTLKPSRVPPPVAGPETFGDLGEPYDWMPPAAKDHWREIGAAMAAAGAPLTVVERGQFATYCTMLAQFGEATAKGEVLPASFATTMSTIATKILNRERLAVAPQTRDPLDELLDGTAG